MKKYQKPNICCTRRNKKMAKKNNWKNLGIYLNPDFKNRYSNCEEVK